MTGRDDRDDEVSPEEDAAIREVFRSPPKTPPRLRVVEGRSEGDDATDEDWLLTRARGEHAEHPDPARAASYERLEGALAKVPPPAPPDGWQDGVWAEIDLAEAEKRHARVAAMLGRAGGWMLATGALVALGGLTLGVPWLARVGAGLAVAGVASLAAAYAHDRLAERARERLAERERGHVSGSRGAGRER